MNLDWKDALEALRNSGSIPVDHTPDAEPGENPEPALPKDTLHVSIERKGRNGKTATLIWGFSCSDEMIDDIARRIKQKLGAGGSARGGEILIQGDRKADVCEVLRSLGFKVK